MTTRNNELERFKTKINFCEYAESLGFVLDKRGSSRCSAVMRHANGDKIVVARTASRHWVYFNVHGVSARPNGDSGTIIDFVQARKKLSLGEVRKELRPWLGNAPPFPVRPPTQLPVNLRPTEHDAAKVLGTWMNGKQIGDTQAFLVNDRRIPCSVLADPIFADRLRIDRRSNILFPHWNRNGSLCGYEVKNRSFTGFAPGGTKGLWCSRPLTADHVMVLAETAIDALSVAAIFGTDGKRFFSTAGQISPSQATCICSAVSRMPANAEIWLAFDHDNGGLQLAQQVKDALVTLTNNTRKVIMSLPPNFGEDWNDVLRNEAKLLLPRFHNE